MSTEINEFLLRLPQDMQTALTAAKMAEACGYRKHNDSINAIYTFKDKPRENRNTEKNENEINEFLLKENFNTNPICPTLLA
jgi:hypothetical protein